MYLDISYRDELKKNDSLFKSSAKKGDKRVLRIYREHFFRSICQLSNFFARCVSSLIFLTSLLCIKIKKLHHFFQETKALSSLLKKRKLSEMKMHMKIQITYLIRPHFPTDFYFSNFLFYIGRWVLRIFLARECESLYLLISFFFLSNFHQM